MNVIYSISIHLGARSYDLSRSNPFLVILLLCDKALNIVKIRDVVNIKGILRIQFLCLCQSYCILEHLLEVCFRSHLTVFCPDGDGVSWSRVCRCRFR